MSELVLLVEEPTGLRCTRASSVINRHYDINKSLAILLFRSESPREPSDGSQPQPGDALNEEAASRTLQATDSMCHHCFDVLLKELKGSKRKGGNQSFRVTIDSTSPPEFVQSLPDNSVECPLFITWDKLKHPPAPKQARDGYELRGCIGTLAPKPLVSSIGEYALISALRDKRFDPVSLLECPHLRVSVSLLVQYEECEHCHDWNVGIHGIMIRWKDTMRNTEYSATYLPEVASEQGWNQVAAVQSLIRKAGFRGGITEEMLKTIQCTRYQSSKQKVTFGEYAQERGQDPSSLLQGNAKEEDGRKTKAARSSTPPACVVQ